MKNRDLPGYAAQLGGIIGGLVALVGAPFVGKFADGSGVRVVTVTVAAALVLGWPPFKFLLGILSVLTLTLVQVILGRLLAFYFGPLPRCSPRCSPLASVPPECRCPSKSA